VPRYLDCFGFCCGVGVGEREGTQLPEFIEEADDVGVFFEGPPFRFGFDTAAAFAELERNVFFGGSSTGLLLCLARFLAEFVFLILEEEDGPVVLESGYPVNREGFEGTLGVEGLFGVLVGDAVQLRDVLLELVGLSCGFVTVVAVLCTFLTTVVLEELVLLSLLLVLESASDFVEFIVELLPTFDKALTPFVC
jgi:hypothetical protein